jgi:hypothetical protein
MMPKDSSDEKISKASIRVRTGRKSNAREALKEAESRLEHQDIAETLAQGRLRLVLQGSSGIRPIPTEGVS